MGVAGPDVVRVGVLPLLGHLLRSVGSAVTSGAAFVLVLGAVEPLFDGRILHADERGFLPPELLRCGLVAECGGGK